MLVILQNIFAAMYATERCCPAYTRKATPHFTLDHWSLLTTSVFFAVDCNLSTRSLIATYFLLIFSHICEELSDKVTGKMQNRCFPNFWTVALDKVHFVESVYFSLFSLYELLTVFGF